MASAWSIQLHTVSFPRRISGNVVEITEMGLKVGYRSWNRKIRHAKLVVRAATGDAEVASSDEDNKQQQRGKESHLVVVETEKEEENDTETHDVVARFPECIVSLPPINFLMKKHPGTCFAIGLFAAATMFVMVVKGLKVRRKMTNHLGSVADLVRRGQLRSDRRGRGISAPLKYDDPFNNPMVKVSKRGSTVEMCGKVYKLAPVSLTKEQQAVHKKRRSRAYQWKRPTIFLREGDPIPPLVDPDTVRWIPANHPFATTASEIDEDLAQTNVYQTHGVPFRIKAEHEALQRRLEALQNDQKLGKFAIDLSAVKEFERPSKSNFKSEDQDEPSPADSQFKPRKSDHAFKENKPASEEMQKP